ncbi:MAG: hypothetical protein OXP37_05350 [Chloroflexota bacterium]|nr:hypothetical protein [Chloroflexota bacterium]
MSTSRLIESEMQPFFLVSEFAGGSRLTAGPVLSSQTRLGLAEFPQIIVAAVSGNFERGP